MSIQRTPGGLSKTIFRYKSQLQLNAKLVLPVKGDVTSFTSDRGLSMCKPQVCIGVQ